MVVKRLFISHKFWPTTSTYLHTLKRIQSTFIDQCFGIASTRRLTQFLLKTSLHIKLVLIMFKSYKYCMSYKFCYSFDINKGLVLLKLAGTMLILIYTSQSNVKYLGNSLQHLQNQKLNVRLMIKYKSTNSFNFFQNCVLKFRITL